VVTPFGPLASADVHATVVPAATTDSAMVANNLFVRTGFLTYGDRTAPRARRVRRDAVERGSGGRSVVDGPTGGGCHAQEIDVPAGDQQSRDWHASDPARVEGSLSKSIDKLEKRATHHLFMKRQPRRSAPRDAPVLHH